jgi:hypothetical protein
MKLHRIPFQIIILALVISATSCGGGGGGAGLLTGVITNEGGAPLTNGQYSVQGSGYIGSINTDGKFTIQAGNTSGRLMLLSYAPTFRFRRIPYDTSGTGGFNLGNVVLPDDGLSRGWAAYRAGDLPAAEARFSEHILSAGRDLPDAHNGLGWALARSGRMEEASNHLISALGAGFDADARTALAVANLGKTLGGEYSVGEAISNLDLAIGDEGFYLSQPLHDAVSEDDLIAFRALLNMLDGRISAAVADRNTVVGKTDAKLNPHSEDLLVVVDFFIGE